MLYVNVTMYETLQFLSLVPSGVSQWAEGKTPNAPNVIRWNYLISPRKTLKVF